MRAYDIIFKKKRGQELSYEELNFMVQGFTEGSIPDYQMSAFLMAVYFMSMTERETADLTMAMARSGDVVDLSGIKGIKVDKHSTGGVGDKTTLVISPIAAALGVPVAKMSGRGLGHTGGTIDKLEAIKGFRTAFKKDEFLSIVEKRGICIAGQSGNLAPADKKIYALRDATATVDSLPLIAASIMSKKIAAGSDAILLDVKTGSGAFMKSVEESIKLAETMVDIGQKVGKRMAALVTDMDIPLGYAIGNSLEVIEAVNTLKGNGPKDLLDICVELAANMVYLGGIADIEEARGLVKEAIQSGRALDKLAEMVEAQSGDSYFVYDVDKFEKALVVKPICSQKSGYITAMDTEGLGIASVILGAGREKVDSKIDYSAGILLSKKTGDYVSAGEEWAKIFTSSEELYAAGEAVMQQSLVIGENEPERRPHIFARVDNTGVIKNGSDF